MRRKISLYIGDRLADLDDQSFILFNYTMEEMSNPTIVRNSFSQTVKLKRTQANNAIFGSFFRPDRRTTSEGEQTGADFNPLERVPFSIFNEMGEVIESGYIKLNSVTKDGYEITMYGGLGSYFYGLSYNEDGSKKNLADLVWKGYDGTDFVRDSPISFAPDWVLEGWEYLRSATQGLGRWYNFLNYALCADGFVEGFDYKHAVINEDTFMNFPGTRTEGEEQWRMNGQTTVTFENNHTPTETGNIVSTLLRPVVSVKELIRAIADPANNGGFTVNLDPDFFSSSNDWYNRGWITLDIPARKFFEGATTNIRMDDLFDGTSTPAEYLIGFAKMFGLVFVTDNATGSISIYSRNNFYSGGSTIDLSSRIERGTEKVQPYLLESRYYVLRANEMKGAFADQYKERYDHTYGEQVINTGYAFDVEPKELLDSIVYKGAADVLAKGSNYLTLLDLNNARVLKFARGESVTVKMFQGSETTKDFPPSFLTSATTVQHDYDLSYPTADIFPMAQFCDQDGKPVGGANVLLVLSAVQNIPQIGTTGIYHDFYLSNGVSTAGINDGTPCFDLRRTGKKLTFLPSFRRWRVQNNTVTQSFEFGIPMEVSDWRIGAITAGGFVYEAQWKRYLSDRYDVDTKVVTAKVDLRGLNTGEALLRNFYWFDNCLWVMNRIINHSLTTWDNTQCEFVRVKDTDNYTEGQNY